MSGLDPQKMRVYIELVRRKAELPPEKQEIVSELGKRFAAQAGGDPTGKGVDTFAGTVLPEALGTMRSALMAPIENPKGVLRKLVGLDDPMNLDFPKALISDVKSGKPELAVGKVLGAAGAAGVTAGVAKGVRAAGRALPSAPSLIPKPKLNPVQKSAIATAEAEGLPIDAATRTQSRPIKVLKKMTDVWPVVSRHGSQFNLALDKALTDTVAKFSGASKSEAGQFVQVSLKKQIEGFQKTANEAYGAVREGAKASRVQSGMEKFNDIKTGTVQQRPVFKTVKGATDISGVKQSVSKLVSEIEKEIPMAQRDASPGLAALKQIAALDDITDLATADSALSQLKAIVRDSKSPRFSDVPALRTRSQGIAASIIRPMTSAIDDAAEAAGVSELLAKGRTATRQKWATADMLAGLSEEPVRAVEFLTAQGDRSITSLNRVLNAAPPAKVKIGESIIQGILEKATNEGGFKADKAFADWNKLGAETKTALYGKEGAAKLDNIFQYGKMAKQNVNPSGTSDVLIGASGYGLASNPIGTILGYAGMEGAARLIYRQAAGK